MKTKRNPGMGFGAITLFMMFVVLAMVILSSLSLLDANHHERLAQKEKEALLASSQKEAIHSLIQQELLPFDDTMHTQAESALQQAFYKIGIDVHVVWEQGWNITVAYPTQTLHVQARWDGDKWNIHLTEEEGSTNDTDS